MALDEEVGFEPSFKEPLLSLDYYVWSAHRSVANAARVNLGWDKYDCADNVEKIATICLYSHGALELASGFFSGDSSKEPYVFGAILCSAGILIQNYLKKGNNESRKIESNYFVKTGAVIKAELNRFRALMLPLAVSAVSSNFFHVYNLISGGDASLNDLASAEGILGSYVGAMFLVSGFYFTGQTYISPGSEKKSLVSALYEGVKKRVMLLPAPVPIPIKE